MSGTSLYIHPEKEQIAGEIAKYALNIIFCVNTGFLVKLLFNLTVEARAGSVRNNKTTLSPRPWAYYY